VHFVGLYFIIIQGCW